MSNSAKTLYDKYVDYVRCLQADADRAVRAPVSPACRATLLSYDDFCRTWEAWGKTAGLQERWRERFELGFQEVAAGLCAQLEAAIAGTDSTAHSRISRAVA